MRNFPVNLLASAQTVIGTQEYQLEEWSERSRNERGIEVNSYSDAKTRKASVQPLDAKDIQLNGLKANQIYIDIFDKYLVSILSRSANPPRITWDGYYWEPVAPANNWNEQGGWNQVTCIRQKAAS